MKLLWNRKNGTIELPRSAASAAECASRAELAVLLLMAAEPDCLADTEGAIPSLAEGADCSEDEVRAAIRFWRGAGVLSLDRKRRTAKTEENVTVSASESEVTPTAEKSVPADADAPERKRHLQKADDYVYSGEETERLLEENDGSRRQLLELCQNIAGKVFNTAEVNRILRLSDSVRLDNEYILLIFTYCKNIGKPSVHYAEKTALNLFDEGVDDTEKLKEYLKRREEAQSYEGMIRRVFGIGARALTAREKKLTAHWQEELASPEELVRCAYEICVDATGSVSFPYIDRILTRYAQDGIRTAEQAEKDREAHRAEKQATAEKGASFDTDEFLRLSLERSRQMADTLKRSENGGDTV